MKAFSLQPGSRLLELRARNVKLRALNMCLFSLADDGGPQMPSAPPR